MSGSKRASRIENRRKKDRKRTIWSVVKKILTVFLILGAVAGIAAGVYLYTILGTLDKFDPDALDDYQLTTFVYDSEDNLISSIHGIENRIQIPLSEIPVHVQDAFISAEDRRFRSHPGFDIRRIFGSLLQNIKAGGIVAGGGTITQQVIRNTVLTQEKTIDRKVKEIFLAWQLEKKFSKDQILEMYLNVIYFAEGAYGIEAASRTYFGKSASELTVAEGALLAGIIKNPHKNSPFINMDRALQRKDLVISLMVKYGKLTPEEGEAAKNEKIEFAEDTKPKYEHGYFMDMVMSEAASLLNVGQEQLYTGGYRIYTTLDKSLQEHAEALYADDSLFPKSPVSGETCESALIVLDTTTGEIRAILGGRRYPEGQRKVWNRALEKRQPGSAIKPLVVYAPAIELNRYTPATLVEDAPVSFGDYSPRNADNKFDGFVTVRTALADSINIPAVKILHDIGVNQGISFAEQMGLEFDPKDRNSLTVALGGLVRGISPIDLARAYTVLGDRGAYKDYTTIRCITDSYGNVLYEHRPQKKQVLTEETAFLVSSILQSAAGPGGTAWRLSGLKLAAKTGTVQLPETAEFNGISGINDAWIAAYNPDYTLAIWMGFDRTTAQNYLPSGTYGGNMPAQLARRIFDFLYEGAEPPDFVQPMGVITVDLDRKALEDEHRVVLASPMTPDEYVLKEYFRKDTVPTEQSEYWVAPGPPYNFSVVLNEDGFPVISFTPSSTLAAYNIMRIEEDGGSPTLVRQIVTGTLDPIEVIDHQVAKGKTYGYYVLPLHTVMKQDGKPVEGTPTETIKVEIPGRGGDIWDWFFNRRGD
ncbi:MAG TPA: PBP1A family penicillin-binding protein [Candidatus Atribacteria bacterium]|nr:PBP1A family penicillin-binding protein [Candidatus Atribacteria bacterium]